jgi:hypothetical protein
VVNTLVGGHFNLLTDSSLVEERRNRGLFNSNEQRLRLEMMRDTSSEKLRAHVAQCVKGFSKTTSAVSIPTYNRLLRSNGIYIYS